MSNPQNNLNVIGNMENTILLSLMANPTYFTKAYPHFDIKHFQTIENQEIFRAINSYYSEYQTTPSLKEIGLKLREIPAEKLREATINKFKEIAKEERVNNMDFLIKESQEYARKQEIKRAIIMGGDAYENNKDLTPVYNLIAEAMKINFDADVGMQYSELSRRIEYYKKKVQGLPTGVKQLDDMFGGFRSKTLTVIGSVSHGGKSLFMSSCASHLLLQGKNVLFLALEMSEEETAKRIDANVLNIDINTFKSTSEEVFFNAYNSVKDKIGKMIIKEHPAGSFDVLKLESLLTELWNELEFKPDIIFVDYLTLMKSVRAKPSIGTYQYYKLIAEELHGFAKKFDLPIVTAAQLNRGAYGNLDAGMESIADSLGIAQTADVFFSIIRSKEMDEMNQVLVSFYKNRNTGNLNNMVMGIDYPYMRYYDLSNTQVFDNEHVSDKLGVNIDELDMFKGLDLEVETDPWDL